MDATAIEVVAYRPDLAADFARLNREWIEHYFEIEPADEHALDNPEGHVIEPGGAIFFALCDTETVGTVALIPHGESCLELAKMAVTEAAQGLGIGRLLMNACLEHACAQAVGRVFLITNSILTPAVSLYESVGFRRLEGLSDGRFARGDLEMELRLD
jgi:GNAT superfamily N-acetyltransferase